jgi:hypothetical protein
VRFAGEKDCLLSHPNCTAIFDVKILFVQIHNTIYNVRISFCSREVTFACDNGH